MKKRIISILLSVVCLSSVITPASANAKVFDSKINYTTQTSDNENEVSTKTNFYFIQTTDLSSVEYTYEENNKSYLVKENANSDLTRINTEIYEVNNDSNVLVDKYVTTLEVNDNLLTITKYVDNYTISDEININEGYMNVNNINSRASGTHTGGLQYDYINHKYYTLWFDTGTSNGTNKITNYTLTVIIAVLGATSGTAGAGLAAVAQIILNEKMPIVYWTKKTQELWEVTYPGRQYIGWAVGVKTYTTFYSDSSRTKSLGTETDVYHDPVYWPSDMNW